LIKYEGPGYVDDVKLAQHRKFLLSPDFQFVNAYFFTIASKQFKTGERNKRGYPVQN
jgi:hypothetical protein